jgi:hypothetical protein
MAPSAEEAEIIELFRRLSPPRQALALALAQKLLD